MSDKKNKTDWLSSIEEDLAEYCEHGHESSTWFTEEISLMARVLRELAAYARPASPIDKPDYENMSDAAKELLDD